MDLVVSEEDGGLKGKDGSSGLETEHTVNDARYIMEVGRPASVSCVQDEVVDSPPNYLWQA